MILVPKRYWLLFAFCFSLIITHAQNLNWLQGTWQGVANKHKNQAKKTLVIESVNGINFKGTKSYELNDRSHGSIITSISGYIADRTFYIKTDSVLSKIKPQHGDWFDCSHCIPANRVIVTYDSVFLSSEIIGCADYCDGTSVYYKLMPDFDTATQRSLVNQFGTPEQIAAFKPSVKQPPDIASSDPDQVKPKINQDSINNAIKLAKKKQQQFDDSLKLAAALEKKRLQHIEDSASVAKKAEQQHIRDSLTNAAIALKKRQQQIVDSTNAADAFTKKRQQQINDSLQLAASLEKKRFQHIQDSLDVVKQKLHQHIQDSITNAAIALKKRQQLILDSTNAANAMAKKRQQQVEDSLNRVNAVAKIRQQEIDDSIKLATTKQHIIDSLKTVSVKSNDKSKALTQRDNILLQTYHINTPDILVELFDNAEIDGDRVSVFHNNEVIVNNQTLLHEPIILKIHADSAHRTHEFILIAENLGTIPPNTALMRITVGTQVYKLSVKTDLKTNAKIDFFYDGN